MMLIAEASTVHVPTVDRGSAPDPTLTTIWLWGFCHRYSSTTPRYVMFLLMSNIAREWWASVGAAVRATPTATARASNVRRAGTTYRLTWMLVPPPGAPLPASPLETTFTQSESLPL